MVVTGPIDLLYVLLCILVVLGIVWLIRRT